LAASQLISGLDLKSATNYLENFQGIKRRSEYLGRKGSVLVYDDYAHHPTEIKTTLKAFKDRFKNKKIFLVFQPHQLERLNSFFDNFVSSLIIADKVIVVKTFQPVGRGSFNDEGPKQSIDLSMILNQSGSVSYYSRDYNQAAKIAGPVYEVARKYLKSSK